MDLTPLKSRLEKLSCSEHGSHPKITLVKDGFDISCCCDNFKRKLSIEAKNLYGELVKDELKKAFKAR